MLDGADLRRYFDVVVDGHQVRRPKPFPDVYERAAELLGVSPANCVVFEDSPTGIEAAKAAGTRVVGVQTHTAELPAVDLRLGWRLTDLDATGPGPVRATLCDPDGNVIRFGSPLGS